MAVFLAGFFQTFNQKLFQNDTNIVQKLINIDPGAAFGHSWAFVGHSLAPWGTPGAHLGGLGGTFGLILEPLGVIFRALGIIREVLRSLLGSILKL